MSSIFQSMIQKRKQKQEERIARGLASGKLTTDQASQLEGLEDQTGQMTQQALADGQISNEEFKSIMDSYKSNGRQIREALHPDQARNDCHGCDHAKPQDASQTASQAAAADEFYRNLQSLAQAVMTSRESRLDARLQAGQASGKYSADQLAELQKLQAQANQSVAGANADGTITAAEFLQTMQAQNALSGSMRQYNANQGQQAVAAAVKGVAEAAAAYKPLNVSV
ncbi:hypothetical protein [Fundidesulfovibrio soli]|uniref:hypothetical protein n=1 Tax=Fundidesulfovibrio soli TaxID=2922716 RepID=UPI001FAF96E9|nr:hypothetical protein [Fundidesulfovibrio soli]